MNDEPSSVKVIEVNAGSESEVEQAIANAQQKGYRLEHLAVCMDADGARYYTLVFQARPVFVFEGDLPNFSSWRDEGTNTAKQIERLRKELGAFWSGVLRGLGV